MQEDVWYSPEIDVQIEAVKNKLKMLKPSLGPADT
jgi:hypothetical protein